jgi:hypothetical protein
MMPPNRVGESPTFRTLSFDDPCDARRVEPKTDSAAGEWQILTERP